MLKTKYILLELKVPGPMSATSETYKPNHDLELVDILPNVSFTRNGTERDYY